MTEAKVVDLHFHDLRHTFTTWLQNLGVPLEVRAALLGHRLRGIGQDQLGGESVIDLIDFQLERAQQVVA